MRTWTYRYEELMFHDESKVVDRLNELGAQGWECFNVETEGPGGVFARKMRCWLKRPGRPLDPSHGELD